MGLARLFSLWRSPNGVRFQVMSDLHLEVCQQYANFDVLPRAPRLILAGDIGRLADYEKFCDFLSSVCQNFKQVFLVLGNHEFFGIAHDEGLRRAEQLQREPGLKDKLIIMNQKRVDVENVTILGCTLYSKVPAEAEETVRCKVGDFHHVTGWTVADHNAAHTADVKWLEKEITSIRRTEAGLKRTIVVVSHHAPLTKGTSNPAHENSPWGSAFATDLIGTKERTVLDDVQWWIFGHTHFSTKMACGGVKLLSNQRGYIFPNEHKRTTQVSSSDLPKALGTWARSRRERDVFNPEVVIEV